MKIHEEDQYNDCYGRERMYLALQQRKDAGKTDIDIPCEATVRKVMVQIGLIHKPRRKPNGITKADRLAQKSDDLLRRDFTAAAPLKKCVTDITEIKAKDGNASLRYPEICGAIVHSEFEYLYLTGYNENNLI